MPKPDDRSRDVIEISRRLHAMLGPAAMKDLTDRGMEEHKLFMKYLDGIETISRKQVLEGKFESEDGDLLRDFTRSFSVSALESISHHMQYLERQWPLIREFVDRALTHNRRVE